MGGSEGKECPEKTMQMGKSQKKKMIQKNGSNAIALKEIRHQGGSKNILEGSGGPGGEEIKIFVKWGVGN